MLGPVPLWAASVGGSVVVGVSVVGVWLTNWIDVQSLEGPEEHEEETEGEASAGRLSRKTSLEELRKKFINVSGEKGANHFLDRRKRKPYPDWVVHINTFQRLILLAFAALFVCTTLSIFQRPPNYFDMAGVKASSVNEASFGLDLARAVREKRDSWPKDWTKENQTKILSLLRKGGPRQIYDLYGSFDAKLQTVGDLFSTLKSTIAFYACYFVLLTFLSNATLCLRKAYTSGTIVLGVLFTLDISVSLGLTKVREQSWIQLIPHVDRMTTYEMLHYFRFAAAPTLLCACIAYSCHTYIDYEEHMYTYTLKVLNSLCVCFDQSGLVLAHTKERMAVLGSGKGGNKAQASPTVRQRKAVPSKASSDNDASNADSQKDAQGNADGKAEKKKGGKKKKKKL